MNFDEEFFGVKYCDTNNNEFPLQVIFSPTIDHFFRLSNVVGNFVNSK